jgi:RHS repeat-associated protein
MTTVKESGTTTLATYIYDAMSRRASLAYPHTSMTYGYSDAGDLTSLAETPASGSLPTWTLTYTNAHQLWTETSSDSTYIWQPSAAHTDSYSPTNKLNQYTAINGGAASGHDCQGIAQQYSYDCNGNLTGDGTWSYVYDQENRMLSAAKTAGGTVSASYAYDTLGRRTHKSGTGVTESYFLNDGESPIADYNGSGTETWRYVPGVTIDQLAAAVPLSGTRRFYFPDHHGSTVAATNNAGAVIEGPYTYDTWGNCFTTGGVSCPNNTAPFRFVGMRYDVETGLYYDRARYYSPLLGRFTQVDPVGYDVDLNLYTYVGNDPTDLTDPAGREIWGEPKTLWITAGIKDHAIWLIIPENQKFWKQDKLFSAHMGTLPDGRVFTTISGGYVNDTWAKSWNSGSYYGSVKMGIGWGDDMSTAASQYEAKKGMFKADTGGHEDTIIRAMLSGEQNFEAHLAKGEGVPYVPDPDHQEGYNSNSAFTGIGRHAGVPVPNLPRAPGAGEPIPEKYFMSPAKAERKAACTPGATSGAQPLHCQ